MVNTCSLLSLYTTVTIQPSPLWYAGDSERERDVDSKETLPLEHRRAVTASWHRFAVLDSESERVSDLLAELEQDIAREKAYNAALATLGRIALGLTIGIYLAFIHFHAFISLTS